MPSIIVGLLAFAMGLWGLSVWWYSVEELLRGLVPLLLLLFGMVALIAGVSRVATAPKDDRDDEELIDLADELEREEYSSTEGEAATTETAAARDVGMNKSVGADEQNVRVGE